MKILYLDIETSPNICYTWGLFNQNISLSQIVEPGETLCWAAKWDDNKEVMFRSYQHSMDIMLKEIWHLLDEADVVVHYYGTKFDIPTLNREFVKYGLGIPSPYHQVDLCQVVKKRFKFVSNKLDFVCQQLGLGAKIQHKGMSLWHDCLQGDRKAWNIMEKYNKQDVKLLPKLYKKLRPWIQGHPNAALFDTSTQRVCTNCGSHRLNKRGTVKTLTMKYDRYRCMDCGKWQRGRHNVLSKEKRENVMVGVT